jgi:3-oxoacyl-[acyl-carrier-protein] synthase II
MKARIRGIGYVTGAGFGAGLNAGADLLCADEVRVPQRKEIFAGVDRRYGRLDSFSRLGLAALALCLRDAAMEEWEEKRAIGIVAASRYGCVNTDLDYLDTMLPDEGRFASPNLFAYTLPNCFLGEAALRFGLSGTSVVLNHLDPGGLAPLEYAMEELHWSAQTGMLAGMCDLPPALEGVSDAEHYGSMFFLLHKVADTQARAAGEMGDTWKHARGYAYLESTPDGLHVDGRPVADLAALLQACAGNRPQDRE